jgi:hypothetical protein
MSRNPGASRAAAGLCTTRHKRLGVEHHNQVAAATLLLGTDSWWVGANIPGKPRTLYPYVGGVGPFGAICHEVAEKGYEGLVLTRTEASAPAAAGG